MNNTLKVSERQNRLDLSELPQMIKAGSDLSIYQFIEFEHIVQFDSKVPDNNIIV